MNNLRPSITACLAASFQILTVMAALLVFSCPPAEAIAPLPKVGVDYQQMKVTDPTILKGHGMADTKNGDAVKLDFSRPNELILRNLRTGESITLPPPGGR